VVIGRRRSAAAARQLEVKEELETRERPWIDSSCPRIPGSHVGFLIFGFSIS
ncbi:hypothetical protein AMECASPLE_012420, partial [Ameca splendens]